MAGKILPRKSLGQNFLIDHNIARKIISLVDLNDQNSMIEIGPGKGILTEILINYRDLLAVEIDPRCADYLRERFGHNERLKLILGDFLKLDISLLPLSRKMTWIGNLPYHITSPILFKLLDIYPRVTRAVFMVQKEVGARVCATQSTKDYGILSVLLQTFYQTRKDFVVSRNVFRPKPKVDSAVISLELKEKTLSCSMRDYQLLVKTAFNQRRKSIRNSLSALLGDFDLSRIGLNSSLRAEEISVEEWTTLGSHLFQKKSHT